METAPSALLMALRRGRKRPALADAGEARLAVHCGGSETLGIPGRGGVTAATLDSKSSAREGVRVQLPPPVPFLDNVPRRLVGWSLAWGCSSVGRAQGWQSWGQGFDSPQLHQTYPRSKLRQFPPVRCHGVRARPPLPP